MKIRPLSRTEIRQVDQIAIDEYGIPGLVLMENAGSGAAKIIAGIVQEGPIAILCGKGNNAGDGYVIARHLELAGRSIQIFSVVPFDELSGDAAVNHAVAARSKMPMTAVQNLSNLNQDLSQATCIVDASDCEITASKLARNRQSSDWAVLVFALMR